MMNNNWFCNYLTDRKASEAAALAIWSLTPLVVSSYFLHLLDDVKLMQHDEANHLILDDNTIMHNTVRVIAVIYAAKAEGKCKEAHVKHLLIIISTWSGNQKLKDYTNCMQLLRHARTNTCVDLNMTKSILLL